MPTRYVAFLDQVPAPLRQGLAQLRESLGVPTSSTRRCPSDKPAR